MEQTATRPRHFWPVAAASLLACAASPAFASHAGDIDGNFGLGGFVTNDFFGTDEQVFAVAPMRDGRLVAAGKVTGANANGSATPLRRLASARLAADGKILALGESGDRGMTVSMARRSDHRVFRRHPGRPACSSPSRSVRDVAFPSPITLLESRSGRDAVPPVPGDQVRGVAKFAC
jgi:hypothetical protein